MSSSGNEASSPNVRLSQTELLWMYVVGDEDFHGFSGLIDRVSDRVLDLSTDSGPQYKSGSVSGVTDHKPQPSSTDEAHVFVLYLGVREWLGLGSNPVVETRRLVRYRKSDVELLTRNKGLLWQVKQRVKQRLTEGSEKAVNEVHDLVGLFLDWLDNHCAHSLQPMDGPDGITVLVCQHCEARVAVDQKGRWTAV